MLSLLILLKAVHNSTIYSSNGPDIKLAGYPNSEFDMGPDTGYLAKYAAGYRISDKNPAGYLYKFPISSQVLNLISDRIAGYWI